MAAASPIPLQALAALVGLAARRGRAASPSPASTTASASRRNAARKTVHADALRASARYFAAHRRARRSAARPARPCSSAMAAPDPGAQRALGRLSGAGHQDRDPLPRPTPRSPAAWCPVRSRTTIVGRHRRAICATIARAGVTLEISTGDHGSKAYAIPAEHPGLALAERVLEGGLWQKRPCACAWGRPSPSASSSARLGAETVFFSFSTADEDYHAPNEFFRLQRLKDGTRAWARYWQELGRLDATAFRKSSVGS